MTSLVFYIVLVFAHQPIRPAALAFCAFLDYLTKWLIAFILVLVSMNHLKRKKPAHKKLFLFEKSLLISRKFGQNVRKC